MAGKTETSRALTREIYDAFQRVELDRWDAVVADDVLLNSPAGFEIRGLATFKEFAANFTDVADNTLDLRIYEWERGWPTPHNIRPEPLVVGADRRG